MSIEGSFPLPNGTVVSTLGLDLQKLEERLEHVEACVSFLGEHARDSDENGLLAQIAALTQRVAEMELRVLAAGSINLGVVCHEGALLMEARQARGVGDKQRG